MSLHNLVSGVIGSINPMQKCKWQKCTGATTAVGGKRTPTYAQTETVLVQIQQLTYADMKHMNDMNMAGITRKIWCNTILTGVDREAGLGGDLITLSDGTIWLVAAVPEVWPDWCTALLKKQVA